MQRLCAQFKLGKNILVPAVLENSMKALEKLQQIFSENQVSILELLAQKKNALPVAEFAKLVKAISTVSLGSFDEPAIKKVFPGACDRPNAIYIPGMHRVFVCPSLMNYPSLTLQQILAHELGHAIQKMQDYVPCFGGYPKAQRDEVFADWVASKVLAGKIASEKNSITAGKQAFESQLLFLSLACGNTQKTKPDWAHSHPNLQNRVERIFLSQPAFQEALRCESKNVKSCG
jgi:Zn-dependent protease with chaperone function